MQVEVNAEYRHHQQAQQHHQKREAEEAANGSRGLALILADQYNPVESVVVALKARIREACQVLRARFRITC
jgi:hypothetical protein